MDNVWNSSENDGLMEIHHPKQLYSSLRTIMLSFRCMMGAMICGPASPKIGTPTISTKKKCIMVFKLETHIYNVMQYEVGT